MKSAFSIIFSLLILISPFAQESKNARIDSAIKKTDRSVFLPEQLKNFADVDISIPLQDGGRIPSQADLELILQNITIKENARVLIIGNNAGYCAAVFSRIFSSVYLVETSHSQESYSNIFTPDNIRNVNVYYGNSYDYFRTAGPFDVIFIQGGIRTLSSLFIDMLKPDSELLAPMLNQDGIQQLVKYKKSGSGTTISIVGNTFFRTLY
ncbi:MAG: hypothetical protein MJ215_03685 [Spirochaetia bacterium]|nr:hypothetical protein [Spirochaetia bacterium]